MTDFTVRLVSNEADMAAARSIREEVFVVEQRCAPEEEWDDFDEVSRHVLGVVNGAAVAVARWRVTLHQEASVAKLERFAVRAPYRGRGYGRQLVAAVIEDARNAGFHTYFVHAQAHLEPFYETFGFRRTGEPFMEANIPHVAMILQERPQAVRARASSTGDGHPSHPPG